MIRTLAFSLIATTLLSHRAAAQVAHFNGFAEGAVGTTFVDPASGIRFQDGTAPLGPDFVIEYGGADPARPLTSPGNILSAGGHVPGDGIGVTQDFGFTAVLPHLARSLSMDVIYVNGGPSAGFDILLFDELGGFLDIVPFTFGPGNFVEQRIAIPDRAVDDIASFTVANVRDLFSAYDNITIPEPAAMGFFALGALMIRRR